MPELKNPRDWTTHSQLVAESLERQRQAKMLRDWVDKQQNPHVGLRRPRTIGQHVARFWARCDVDDKVSIIAVPLLLIAIAFGARGWTA